MIAGRLGLSKEIIAAARSTIDPDELHAEDLLNEIHRQRDLARRMRGDAESARYEADKLRRELAARMEKIEDERQAVLNQARAEAEHEVEGLRAELDEIRRALVRARQPLEALKPLTEKVEEIQSEVQSPVARRLAEETQSRPLRPGDKVKVRTLKMDGIITTLGVEDAEVQVGNLRVRARLTDLQRGNTPEETLTPVSGTTQDGQHQPARYGYQYAFPHPRRAWNWTCAASGRKMPWMRWTATWKMPTWLACLLCASSMAKAPAGCAR